MSRIGKLPISVPSGVEVSINGSDVSVKGPKGELGMSISGPIEAKLEENTITVTRPDEERESRSLHGLNRTLIANMIVGVTEGYSKKLELHGTGYRVLAKGKDIEDRKSTRLNSSHVAISYAVFCLKKKHTKVNSINHCNP